MQKSLFFVFPAVVFDPEDDRADDAEHDENQADFVAHLHHDGPALAQEAAQPEDQRRPGQRAQDGQHQEFHPVHTREARRKRDERPHHRQHAAEKHGLQPVLVEPFLGKVHMGLLDEEILAVTVHERPSAAAADLVCENRAEDAADHAGPHRPREGHALRVDQVAREAQDQLAGDRHAGVFKAHQKRHREIAPLVDKIQKNVRQRSSSCSDDYFCFIITEKSREGKRSQKKGRQPRRAAGEKNQRGDFFHRVWTLIIILVLLN